MGCAQTLSQMRRELRNVLAQPEHALLAIDFSSPTFNIQTITLLIHGYEQLHECKLLIPYMSSPSDSAKASALGERYAQQQSFAVPKGALSPHMRCCQIDHGSVRPCVQARSAAAQCRWSSPTAGLEP